MDNVERMYGYGPGDHFRARDETVWEVTEHLTEDPALAIATATCRNVRDGTEKEWSFSRNSFEAR